MREKEKGERGKTEEGKEEKREGEEKERERRREISSKTVLGLSPKQSTAVKLKGLKPRVPLPLPHPQKSRCAHCG